MKDWTLLLAAALLLMPNPAVTQILPGRIGGEVIGTASRYQYHWDVDKKWRKAAGVRIRLVFFEWSHLELGYTKAWTRESLACPLSSSCPESRDNPSQALSITAGAQIRYKGWVPYMGVGPGWFSNQELDTGTVVWYLGLQRDILDRLGLLGEYRKARFESEFGRPQRNNEWAFGLVVRPW